MRVDIEKTKLYNEAVARYESQTYNIIGAALEVHEHLGCGFLESVYEEAFRRELIDAGIPFQEQVSLNIYYKGTPLTQYFVPDFICYDNIIVELKAVSELQNIHKAQVINYLKATKYEVGLLLNFGKESLEKKRLFNIYNNDKSI